MSHVNEILNEERKKFQKAFDNAKDAKEQLKDSISDSVKCSETRMNMYKNLDRLCELYFSAGQLNNF